jgi:hypothetical protein
MAENILASHDFGASVPVILKVARHSTDLEIDWDPAGGGVEMYALFESHLADLLTWLDPLETGRTITPAGVFWVQGEGDADSEAKATAYQANVEALIAALRTTLGVVDLPFTLIRLHEDSTAGAHVGLVRAGQDAAAAADPDVYSIDVDDIDLTADGGLHYLADNVAELGRRLLP